MKKNYNWKPEDQGAMKKRNDAYIQKQAEDESLNTHGFETALTMMKSGDCVKRVTWDGFYIKFHDENIYMGYRKENVDSHPVLWLAYQDILAEDWVIYSPQLHK